jgi:hypothetical protein
LSALVELWWLDVDGMRTCALLPLGNVVWPPREEASIGLARRVEDEADTGPHVDPDGRRCSAREL